MNLGLGKWVAVVGCLGIGLGALVTAQGCSVTVSSGPCGDGGCGTLPQVDAASTPPDPCNECLYQQCVGAYSNCVANTSCLTIYQCATSDTCAAADGGGSCVQTCYNAGTAAGQTLYTALGECDLLAECTEGATTAPCAATCHPPADTCALPDAGPPPAVDSGTDSGGGSVDAGATVEAAQTCNECQTSSCGPQLAACAPGTPCATYNQCVLGCADQACSTACQTSNQTGYSAAGALGTCTQQSCGSVCN